MSAKKQLENVLQLYESSKEIFDDAQQHKRNKYVAEEIISSKKGKIKNKNDIIDKYFDELKQRLEDHYILDIITTFEKIIFERIGNASGEISKIVKEEYKKRQNSKKNPKLPTPLYKSAASFIKNTEDIRNLGGAKKILESHLRSKELFDDLAKIIDHRNWLSHGKRWFSNEKRLNEDKDYLLKIEEIYEILIKIIDELDQS